MGWSSSWLGYSLVVRTVLRVETGKEEEETRSILTAVLPEGSKMTSPEKMFYVEGSENKDA